MLFTATMSQAVLATMHQKLYSFFDITTEGGGKLMCTGRKMFNFLPQETQTLNMAFMKCRSKASPLVLIFLSEIFSVNIKTLPQNK